MNLTELLRRECLLTGAECSSAEEALAALATLAKQSPLLADVDESAVLQGLIEREQLSTTGFGGGIAIPHCRLDGVKDFVVGIMTVPGGVDYHAIDGEPAKLFVFIIAPAGSTSLHIKMLSAVSQVLNVPDHVAEMVRAPTSEALAQSFLRHVSDEVDPRKHDSKNLFRVQIQNEELFPDVLKILTGCSSSSVMVTKAEPAANYIRKIPLFAGFWSDKPSEFCKVLHATVDRRDTNETIRRIEQRVGSLDDREDILLTVQELLYCAGSLNI